MILKSLLLFALTLLLCSSVSAQKKNDRERQSLTGAVKSIRSQMTRYAEVNSAEPADAKQLGTIVYDTNGNETERTIYDDYGFLVGREVKTYDAKGNLTKGVMNDDKGKIMTRDNYVYAGGKLTQVITYDAKGAVSLRQLNLYAPDGRLQEQVYYVAKEPAGRTVFAYDRGDLSEVSFFLANGAKAVAPVGPCLGAHRLTYTYDEKGRALKVVAYEPNGEVKRSWNYAYDPKGQVALDTRESESSRVSLAYTYEYDARGNWTKQVAIITSQYTLGDGETSKRKTVTTRDIAYY